MKNLCTSLSLIALASPAFGAISITADNVTNLRITNTSSTWDTTTFPPSSNANVYFDLNQNGTFGEVGENTGNTQGTLSFTTPTISDGTSFIFGLEGFGGAGANPVGSATFTITNTDLTTQLVNVTEGTPVTFFDSNGDEWEVDFEFNPAAYGDVVFNGGTTGTGANIQDHQGVLTFSQIPEPSSAILAALAGLCFLRRKR